MVFRVPSTRRTGHWSQHLWVLVTSGNWLDFLNLARITAVPERRRATCAF